MGEKKASQCRKGDTSVDEHLVERSKTNEKHETISLWKKEDGKFIVACCDDKETSEAAKWHTVVAYPQKPYPSDDLPWALYAACCDLYGCSPYPEAKEYYKKKGISLTISLSPMEHRE